MITSLTAERLVCARGDKRLFENLSFQVRAGQALAVEGANGAGKTSLLRLIAGFIAPVSGRLIVLEAGAESDDAEERGKRIGWLGHHDGLKPQLTVAEQLSFWAALYRGTANADVLAQVGLVRQADLPCRYLSAGQKRRLALARLLVSGRPLWLLDEPLTALDVQMVARLQARVRTYAQAGGRVVLTSHQPMACVSHRLDLGSLVAGALA